MDRTVKWSMKTTRSGQRRPHDLVRSTSSRGSGRTRDPHCKKEGRTQFENGESIDSGYQWIGCSCNRWQTLPRWFAMTLWRALWIIGLRIVLHHKMLANMSKTGSKVSMNSQEPCLLSYLILICLHNTIVSENHDLKPSVFLWDSSRTRSNGFGIVKAAIWSPLAALLIDNSCQVGILTFGAPVELTRFGRWEVPKNLWNPGVLPRISKNHFVDQLSLKPYGWQVIDLDAQTWHSN